jgi:hypothetical protein
MSREESDPGHHNSTKYFEKFTKMYNEKFFDKTKMLYIYHSNNADRFWRGVSTPKKFLRILTKKRG